MTDPLPGELAGGHSVLTWLSLVFACCLVFSVNLGVQPMPLLMSSELYPPDIRAACKVSRQLKSLFMLSLKLLFDRINY